MFESECAWNVRVIKSETRTKVSLNEIFSPITIPRVENLNQIFDLKIFFEAAHDPDFRLMTYQLANYKFPLSYRILIYDLIKNGFFYTLFDCNTQCAYCRMVIGGWKNDSNVALVHKQKSPCCEMVRRKLTENDEPKQKLLGTQDENTMHLCKICLKNEVKIVFEKCRHAVSCKTCVLRIHSCPICRGSINKQSEIFLC
jgi:E3 ubiquitin-protein ligase XIAP